MNSNNFIIYSPSYIIRKGLISVIEKIQNTQIIHQVDSVEEILDLIDNSEIDFLILDIDIEKSIEIFNKIKNKYNKNQLIAFCKDSKHISNKNFIETVSINDSQNEIIHKLNYLLGNKDSHKLNSKIPDEISKREVDILKYIALGFSNKEIADKLFISAHTVVTHRKNITRKLGIKTVPGLTIYAIINKIIDINDTEKN